MANIIMTDENITVKDMGNGIIRITQKELGETNVVFLSKEDIQTIVNNME